MVKCLLALLCSAVLTYAALAESDRNYVTTLPSGIHNNCYPQSVLPWGSCDSNRGEGVNRGRSDGPSINNDLPDDPNVPGGPPIAGNPGDGGTPTPTGGGGGGAGGGGGCVTNCGPGGGPGLGNPGNDKGVGRAGENPNGRPFGPTGRRGKNN